MSATPDRSQLPLPLRSWMVRLSEEEIPIFSQTVSEISRIMSKEEYSTMALSRVILQDPSMTAKVLKLANSVFYNPGGTTISTITRAVMVLGFEAVQIICISIAVIESLVQGPAKERVQRELARSIHAATQARNLSLQTKLPESEEVFIAALLLNLGQMAYWCFAGSEGETLDAALRAEPDEDPDEIEAKVLGFKLSHLTSAIAQEWQLTPLVGEALKGRASKDPRGRFIHLGHLIAREAESGWATHEMKQIVTEASRLLGTPVNQVGSMIQGVAEEAVNTARAMGAGAAARLIPVVRRGLAAPETVWDGPDDWAEPDPMLQLKILREITTIMQGKPDLNIVLEMVLEGIHRGIGMDRTVLAVVSPKRQSVRAKFVLGMDRTSLTGKFHFDLGSRPQNLFSNLMDEPRPVWVSSYNDPDLKGRLFGNIFEGIDRAKFFVEPVLFANQTIGVFYADRHLSQRDLDTESFESFKLFVYQANLGLEYITRQKLAERASDLPVEGKLG